MEPHHTFDNHRIQAYKEHIYRLHHSAQRMQSEDHHRETRTDSASIILHYRINAVLEKSDLLWSGF